MLRVSLPPHVPPGDVLPPDTDEVYNSRHDILERLLSERVREYEEEEHALRVLMREEVKEKMSTQSGE